MLHLFFVAPYYNVVYIWTRVITNLRALSESSTGGRWVKAYDDFFKKVLKANSKGNESVYRASSNYWLSSLSCCLQKSISASIVNSRSKLINGDMLHNPNYKFDED
jgi:hypothetical protein